MSGVFLVLFKTFMGKTKHTDIKLTYKAKNKSGMEECHLN